MKKLLLIFTIFVVSCSTTHKIKTETKTVDSGVVTTNIDTSNVNLDTTTIEDLTAKGVDIQINYDTTQTPSKDTVIWNPIFYKKGSTKVNALLKGLLNTGVGNGKTPTSISIHIDSLGDSVVNNHKLDSNTAKITVYDSFTHKSDIKTKDVKRTGLAVGTYLIIALVVVIGLAVVIIRYKLL